MAAFSASVTPLFYAAGCRSAAAFPRPFKLFLSLFHMMGKVQARRLYVHIPGVLCVVAMAVVAGLLQDGLYGCFPDGNLRVMEIVREIIIRS